MLTKLAPTHFRKRELLRRGRTSIRHTAVLTWPRCASQLLTTLFPQWRLWTAGTQPLPFGLWHTLNAEGSGLDYLTNSQDSWIGSEAPKIKLPILKRNSRHLAINSQPIHNYTAGQEKRPTCGLWNFIPETPTRKPRNATADTA